jgi:hypothetical protein
MTCLPGRPAAVRAAAVAATLFAALAMTAPPAYGEDASPTPSDSPTVTPSPEPSSPPSSAPPSESPDPGDTSPPGTGDPTDPGSPTPPPVDQPPVDQPPGDGPSADPAPVDLSVTVPGPKVTIGSAGKRVRIDVSNLGYGTATNVVLTVDVADLTDAVEVDLPGQDYDCEVSGTTATCRYPDLLPDDIDTFVQVGVKPKSGASLGPVGTMHLSVTSDQRDLDPDNNQADVAVELVASGPDLVAFADPLGPVRPGSSEELHHRFYNYGDQPISGFSFTVSVPPYSSFPEEYEGCETYYDVDDHVIICVASGFTVAPGEGVEIVGILVKIAKNAPGVQVLGRGVFSVRVLDEAARSAAKGSYPGIRKLSGVKSANHDADGDNSVTFPVMITKNPADLAVKVAKAEGEKGDEVKVRFTVTNHGPADLGGFHLTVKAPTGTDIVAAPSDPRVDCTPDSGGDIGHRAADCNYLYPMPAGRSVKFTMKFTVTADKVGDDGRARVDYWSDGDPDLKNNTARIVIGPPGSAGGGGGLPVTGTSLVALLGSGALALLLGVGLSLVSRRRRTATSQDAVA